MRPSIKHDFSEQDVQQHAFDLLIGHQDVSAQRLSPKRDEHLDVLPRCMRWRDYI